MELRIENLTKAYGRKVALCDFTATLSSGIYGLLGPNGAGKSTLIWYTAFSNGTSIYSLC